MNVLTRRLLAKEAELKDDEVQRPENWGGYAIGPVRIEFLEFNASRFHKRTFFKRKAIAGRLRYCSHKPHCFICQL